MHSENSGIKLVAFIEKLLEMISENLLMEDNGDDSSFCSDMGKTRAEILQISGMEIPGSTASHALDLCDEKFRGAQLKRLHRDEDFAEIIIILTRSLANLTGDSRIFHESITETTARIQDLTSIKDLQELKERITAEVSNLNSIMMDKQRREQVQYQQLTSQVTTLQHKLEEAKTEASLDGLTGIGNRRHFDLMIDRWVAAHKESEEPFTMALFDLDNFKQINDGHGHLIGDQVLRFAARELQKGIRASDLLARYGGEEFVILSAGMKLAEAEKRFAEMLKRIGSETLACKGEDNGTSSISFTASCGIAEYALGENAKDLISRADDALYEAKRAGKNRVAFKRRSLLSAFYEGRRRKPVA
jgi:diguanylate cyclase